MPAQLTPSEIAAVRSADKMERHEYREGGIVATDGRTKLFAAGSLESFDALWAQALEVRK